MAEPNASIKVTLTWEDVDEIVQRLSERYGVTREEALRVLVLIADKAQGDPGPSVVPDTLREMVEGGG